VLPSLLTNCTDHPVDPGKGGLLGVGSLPELSHEELLNAYNNLYSMEQFSGDLYTQNGISIGIIYKLLKGDPAKHPNDFTELAIDIFSEILTGVLEVAAEAIPGLGPLLGAAIGVAAKGINVWVDEEKDRASANGLNTTIGTFELNYQKLQQQITLAIDEQLGSPKDNFFTLREKWTDVTFMGKTYGLRELAHANFPSHEKGSPTRTQYEKLLIAANDSFVKYFWRAIIIQTGKLNSSRPFYFSNKLSGDSYPGGAVGFARDVIYKTEDQYPTYTTGKVSKDAFGYQYWHFTNWYFTFDDGVPLSKAVADILFIDDTPGHIINKDGLWPRDYVFKQFHTEKPDWGDERDLGTEAVAHPNLEDDFGKLVNDYKFEGLLKSLTKPKPK
jgi:hypothetical protein